MAETQPTAAPPVVEVVPVAETDVPIYGEWVGTTVGYITAQIRAQKALGGGRQSHPAAGPRPAP